MISQRMHILPILAAQSSNAVHLDISTVVWDACSLCHQWHKPQSHNTWFQAQKIAAAAPDSNTCDFFWAGNVHFLFLGRNSAEHSSKVAIFDHNWALHCVQCQDSHMTLENQEWHEEIHVLCWLTSYTSWHSSFNICVECCMTFRHANFVSRMSDKSWSTSLISWGEFHSVMWSSEISIVTSTHFLSSSG